jgi:hypothetical protein
VIWRSFRHIESTGIIAQVVLLAVMAILGSMGVYLASPVVSAVAGFALFLVIYRLRYKRL